LASCKIAWGVKTDATFQRDRSLKHLFDGGKNGLKSGVLLRSLSSIFLRSSSWVAGIPRNGANPGMMAMLTCKARALRKTLEGMAPPGSVKAGFWHRPNFISSKVSWTMQSAGKRARLHSTACSSQCPEPHRALPDRNQAGLAVREETESCWKHGSGRLVY
jgi:hypothetical protein